MRVDIPARAEGPISAVRTEGGPGAAPGRSYADREGTWAYGRRLVARDGLGSTLVRLLTYPNTPWIRYLWAPAVRLARILTGARTFDGPDGRMPYGPAIGERAVEVPIARWFVDDVPRSVPILEVGNVLAHHAPFPHPVVDRYERAPGVENVDVVGYRPPVPFSRILSVSTLEHVGFDESPPQPGKFALALRGLYHEALAPGGRMLVTLPVGYNPEVDGAVFGRWPELGRITLYRRRGLRNLWDRVPGASWPRPSEVPPYDYRRHRLAYVAIALVDRPYGSHDQPSSP